MKKETRRINKIDDYKVELIEHRPATPALYQASNRICMNPEFGHEYDFVVDGKFIGRVRNEIISKYKKNGKKYGVPAWVVYEEFMGDIVDASINKNLRACVKAQIKRDVTDGHIGRYAVAGRHHCPDYDYVNGCDMPTFGMYQELK